MLWILGYWHLSTYVYYCVLLKQDYPWRNQPPKKSCFCGSLFYLVLISCTCHTEQRKKKAVIDFVSVCISRERERRVRTSKGSEWGRETHGWLSPIYHVITKSLFSFNHPRPSQVNNPSSSSCAQENEWRLRFQKTKPHNLSYIDVWLSQVRMPIQFEHSKQLLLLVGRYQPCNTQKSCRCSEWSDMTLRLKYLLPFALS